MPWTNMPADESTQWADPAFLNQFIAAIRECCSIAGLSPFRWVRCFHRTVNLADPPPGVQGQTAYVGPQNSEQTLSAVGHTSMVCRYLSGQWTTNVPQGLTPDQIVVAGDDLQVEPGDLLDAWGLVDQELAGSTNREWNPIRRLHEAIYRTVYDGQFFQPSPSWPDDAMEGWQPRDAGWPLNQIMTDYMVTRKRPLYITAALTDAGEEGQRAYILYGVPYRTVYEHTVPDGETQPRWHVSDDQISPVTLVEVYSGLVNRCQKGDAIGPWLFNDMRAILDSLFITRIIPSVYPQTGSLITFNRTGGKQGGAGPDDGEETVAELYAQAIAEAADLPTASGLHVQTFGNGTTEAYLTPNVGQRTASEWSHEDGEWHAFYCGTDYSHGTFQIAVPTDTLQHTTEWFISWGLGPRNPPDPDVHEFDDAGVTPTAGHYNMVHLPSTVEHASLIDQTPTLGGTDFAPLPSTTLSGEFDGEPAVYTRGARLNYICAFLRWDGPNGKEFHAD